LVRLSNAATATNTSRLITWEATYVVSGITYTTDIGVLYGTKRPMQYYDNGHHYQNYWTAIYVTYGGSGFVFKFPVHEKHVDIYGQPIDRNGNGNLTDDDTLKMVETGTNYTGIPQTITDYDFVGHNWSPPNSSGTDYTAGPPTKNNILTEYTVYFVYKERAKTVDVAFSKVDAFNTATPLPGATFKVYELICTNAGHDHVNDPADIVDITAPGACWRALAQGSPPVDAVFTSDGAGLVNVGPLPNGYYQIVEITAPPSYQLPVGQWLMTVDVLAPNTAPNYQLAFVAKSPSIMPNAVIRIVSGSNVLYKIVNTKPMELPLSGIGVPNAFTAGGFTLMALMSFGYLNRWRKKPREEERRL